MAMTDLPLVSALRAKLQWHQSRQKVLAENVANANTPGFQPRDLQPPAGPKGAAASSVQVDRTNPLHLAGTGGSSGTGTTSASRFETRPSGNAVTLEDEMLKVAENQSDYQLAASLYQKSLALLRTAAGVRGG
jgi:flagellar basal-body rod protein FlgB